MMSVNENKIVFKINTTFRYINSRLIGCFNYPLNGAIISPQSRHFSFAPAALTLFQCHMAILCLPGETRAGLISKGRLICPETCSRAQFPWCLAQPAAPGGSGRLNTSFTCCSARRKEVKRERKKEKQRHNRKQEQERDLARCAEARCRVWLLPPSAPLHHQHPPSAGRSASAAASCRKTLFTFSPGVMRKPLGRVCVASWWAREDLGDRRTAGIAEDDPFSALPVRSHPLHNRK